MNALESFKNKVSTGASDRGCVLWAGAKTAGGYGNFRSVYAHRIAYELVHGAVPAGKLVLHHCDTRLCVNPKHLFVGTAAENTADMLMKGRGVRGRHVNAKLNQVQVLEIRSAKGTQQEIADRYGIKRQTVGMIRRRAAWGWLSDKKETSNT